MTYSSSIDFGAIAAFLFGLVFGSFLNVVIYRVPRDLSVVKPRSACPNCGTQIRAYDNIPVISWIMLRGKCRDCAHRSCARPAVDAAHRRRREAELTRAGFLHPAPRRPQPAPAVAARVALSGVRLRRPVFHDLQVPHDASEWTRPG